MKVDQEIFVFYGRGFRSQKKVAHTTVTKVGRKYFTIDTNNFFTNEKYHLEQHAEGYFYSAENVGHSSSCYLTEDEVLNAQQGDTLTERMKNAFAELSYEDKVILLKQLENK